MLTDELYHRVEPLIQKIYHEDFIQGVINGNLDKEDVRRYLRADSKYLKEFANLYGLLMTKAEDIEMKRDFYRLVDSVLNETNGAHQILADYLEKDYQTVIDDEEWYPTADHYVKHMYYNAYRYSDPVFRLSTMAACPYVYFRLADFIAENENLTDDNPLKGWVDFYNEPFTDVKNLFQRVLNDAGETKSEAELTTSTRVVSSNVNSLIWRRATNVSYLNAATTNFTINNSDVPSFCLSFCTLNSLIF